MRVFVTGFGPFMDVEDNPSAILARTCGRPFEILEVSFKAVDAFHDGFDWTEFDALLHIGVAGTAERLRLDGVGRNVIGPHPDVLGSVQGPGPIDPKSPALLRSTLWPAIGAVADTEEWEPTVDAGGYLCNYALFRALQRFPDKLVGFLHVPPQDVVPIETQQSALAEILARMD